MLHLCVVEDCCEPARCPRHSSLVADALAWWRVARRDPAFHDEGTHNALGPKPVVGWGRKEREEELWGQVSQQHPVKMRWGGWSCPRRRRRRKAGSSPARGAGGGGWAVASWEGWTHLTLPQTEGLWGWGAGRSAWQELPSSGRRSRGGGDGADPAGEHSLRRHPLLHLYLRGLGCPRSHALLPRSHRSRGAHGGAMGAAVVLGWLLLLLVVAPPATGARPCSPKYFGRDAMVCVCNATYCDTLDPVVLPAPGTYVKYESSKAGKRLERSQGSFQRSLRAPGLLLMLNVSVLYQRVKGFGGSLSDAAALNILGLSQPAQDNLLCSYFSEYGIEYNLVRLPMASSDFSVRPYSYDDVPNDYELKHFSLAEEDVKMKIPLLHRASAMSRRPLALYASPWTAPAWIKSNRDIRGTGMLRGRAGDKCHKTWANYFIKFLDEYAKHNVTFWAVTVQNEPRARMPTFPQFPTISFTAEQQRDFITHDLGPALARSPHRTQLLIMDDQRMYLPQWAETVLGNSTAAGYVAGVAVHWYLDGVVSATCSLGVTHKLFPDHFLLYTEACNGFLSRQFSVALGCWERGERYSHSILTVLNHFVTGWTDWNLALDLQGGPNWVKNYVDSPVIVDSSKDVFYKQPMFYHLGHFSKFIPEGSRRVGLRSVRQNPSCQLEHVAFLRPDGAVVLVVLNRSSWDVPFGICDPSVGFIKAVSPANSIQTYLWQQQ